MNIVFHKLKNIVVKIWSIIVSLFHKNISKSSLETVNILWIFPSCWDTKGLSPHFQTQILAVLVLSSMYPSLISFSPFPVHPTRFSFCFFPGFLAIFILLHPTLPWLPSHFYLIVIATSMTTYQYGGSPAPAFGSLYRSTGTGSTDFPRCRLPPWKLKGLLDNSIELINSLNN